ncbi:MAG: asparagine synthase (glutamine-hydrolyzing), partial [Alphaproteobacteria bacterium]|nr:asparagine synthase (glutamine-hydrolyzing) [Alphaproteobacteria bacterium]
MCGIAGLISPNRHVVDIADISNMSAAMIHRGPDDLGFLGWSPQSNIRIDRDLTKVATNAQVAFAHRRLSIIDEGEGGWQPMATADKRFVITYNGEIYNYIELRAELQSEGEVFTTHSDTEVLLKALARWGFDKTLPKLVGMFAFALLDTEERTVTLARDPFGIKPLSYTIVNNSLAFASETTQLLKLKNVDRKISPQALYDYLRFGLTDRGTNTLFAAIKHLPAAHYATIELDKPYLVTPQRYWRAQLYPTLDISFEEAAAELKALFIDSVKLHLRSDVPVGAALSGGIDSSAVVSAMRML